MPKRSELAMQGLVDRVIKMFHTENLTQKEIAESLKKEGFVASKSAVGRVLKKHSEFLKEIEVARKEAGALVEAVKKTPGTDISDASLQITSMKLLNELREIEDFGELDGEKLVSAIAKVSRAQGYIAKVKLDYAKGFREGLFAGAKAAESAAKKKGVDPETALVIKNSILGLDRANPS